MKTVKMILASLLALVFATSMMANEGKKAEKAAEKTEKKEEKADKKEEKKAEHTEKKEEKKAEHK